MRRDLVVVEVDDDAIVYDPQSGWVHHLDATAALVLQLCDGTATVKRTVAELARAQGVPEQAIDEKVRSLVDDLRRARLLSPGRRDAPAAAEAADTREQVRREVPRND